MFGDEMDEEYWTDLAEDMGEGLGVDVREGSVFMDMQIGHCMRVAKFYADLTLLHEMMMPDTAKGEFLTEYAALDNVYRNAAVASCWNALFELQGRVPGLLPALPHHQYQAGCGAGGLLESGDDRALRHGRCG